MSESFYPPYSNVKILVELLKKHNIQHVVISSGTRHTPLVNLLETDDFFHCYSVVDERSASFFALGLIQTLQKPVAISCTSGTAVCNYISCMAEAHFRNLPLLALTADRDPRLLYQAEQMIPQSQLTEVFCKKVQLPFVETKDDFYYCQRLVNEALLELNHHGQRPVNINYPIEFKGISSIQDVKTELLKKFSDGTTIPDVVKVTRTTDSSPKENWDAKANELASAKKIMVLYGQHNPLNAEEIAVLEEFAEKYPAVYITDNLSNLHCKGSVTTYLNTPIPAKDFENLVPDILITMNGNMMSSIRGRIGGYKKRYHHWMVTGDGHLADPYCSLTDVFECDSINFFRNILAAKEKASINNTYYEAWNHAMEGYTVPEVPYSDVYITLELLKHLPKDSLLHLANSTTIRVGHLLSIDPSITVYCNRGTNGIDGSLSTFIGQSAVSGKLSFLIIGDLSFFYDMNGLWNRYVGNNVRIMLNNNSCGEIFYYTRTIKTQGMLPNLHKHIGAAHETEAKGWVESRGFHYLSAHTQEEYEENLKKFLATESDKPIFFEVFTDHVKNAELMNGAYTSSPNLRGKLVHAGLHMLGLQ